MMPRPIYEIAQDIKENWPNVSVHAKPYLEAMFYLPSINHLYGLESGKSIVIYFLSNAVYWRGPEARRIKKELNDILDQTL